jgi:hypothetical protein
MPNFTEQFSIRMPVESALVGNTGTLVLDFQDSNQIGYSLLQELGKTPSFGDFRNAVKFLDAIGVNLNTLRTLKASIVSNSENTQVEASGGYHTRSSGRSELVFVPPLSQNEESLQWFYEQIYELYPAVAKVLADNGCIIVLKGRGKDSETYTNRDLNINHTFQGFTGKDKTDIELIQSLRGLTHVVEDIDDVYVGLEYVPSRVMALAIPIAFIANDAAEKDVSKLKERLFLEVYINFGGYNFDDLLSWQYQGLITEEWLKNYFAQVSQAFPFISGTDWQSDNAEDQFAFNFVRMAWMYAQIETKYFEFTKAYVNRTDQNTIIAMSDLDDQRIREVPLDDPLCAAEIQTTVFRTSNALVRFKQFNLGINGLKAAVELLNQKLVNKYGECMVIDEDEYQATLKVRVDELSEIIIQSRSSVESSEEYVTDFVEQHLKGLKSGKYTSDLVLKFLQSKNLRVDEKLALIRKVVEAGTITTLDRDSSKALLEQSIKALASEKEQGFEHVKQDVITALYEDKIITLEGGRESRMYDSVIELIRNQDETSLTRYFQRLKDNFGHGEVTLAEKVLATITAPGLDLMQALCKASPRFKYHNYARSVVCDSNNFDKVRGYLDILSEKLQWLYVELVERACMPSTDLAPELQSALKEHAEQKVQTMEGYYANTRKLLVAALEGKNNPEN